MRPPVSLSLSDHEWSAQIRIGLDHCVVSDPQLADEDCDRPNGLLAFPPNSISVGHFADCCRALGEPLSAGDVDRLAEAGQTYYSACLRRWMSRVMEEDRMVDSFVEFFPNARGQFTSWEQYTNGRYVNEVGGWVDTWTCVGVWVWGWLGLDATRMAWDVWCGRSRVCAGCSAGLYPGGRGPVSLACCAGAAPARLHRRHIRRA